MATLENSIKLYNAMNLKTLKLVTKASLPSLDEEKNKQNGRLLNISLKPVSLYKKDYNYISLTYSL